MQSETGCAWQVLGTSTANRPRIGIPDSDWEAALALELPDDVELCRLSALNSGAAPHAAGGLPASMGPELSGILALSEAGLRDAREHHRLAETVPQAGSLVLEPPVRLAPATKEAALTWLVGCLSARERPVAQLAASALRDMAALRVAHEQMQAAFRQLEAYAEAVDLVERTEVLSLTPQGGSLPLGATGAGLLTQRLPIHSVGLSDLAIHVPQGLSGLAARGGTLTVALTAAKDGAELARWRVDAGQIAAGWLRFALRRALDADARTPILSLDWQGAKPLAISTAQCHPEPHWCAEADGMAGERVLALKAWRGVPQTRSTPAASTVALAGTPPQEPHRHWRVGADSLASVLIEAGTADTIRHVPDKSAVLVHPAGRTPTIARLPGAIPAGVGHVRARIETAHPDAAPIDYALAIRPPGGASSSEARRGWSSDWVTLAPGETGEVHLHLPQMLSARADLFLATRIGAEVSDAHCWAMFSDIRAAAAPDGV